MSWLLFGLCCAVALVLSACSGRGAVPEPTPATTAGASVSVDRGASKPGGPNSRAASGDSTGSAAGEVDLEAKGFADSSDGKLRVSGRSALLLSLRDLKSPPVLPTGWALVAPVFDVTARDRHYRAVTQLREVLTLRFDVPAGRPATVLVHDGTSWQVVPSEFDAEGKLVAQVDHLTPYTAARPTGSNSSTAPTNQVQAGQGANQPPATRNGANQSGGSAITRPTVPPGEEPSRPSATPGANAAMTTGPVSSADAETALGAAVKALKGKNARITSAAGYTGTASVDVPDLLEGALGSALGGGGTGYYGLYNALNQAITVEASSGSAAGALTLLVEPKTTLPSNEADAKSQLEKLFPGVAASLTAAQTSNGYVFYATSGNTAYSVGYVSYEGVPLAYAMSGSGSYESLVPKS